MGRRRRFVPQRLRFDSAFQHFVPVRDISLRTHSQTYPRSLGAAYIVDFGESDLHFDKPCFL